MDVPVDMPLPKWFTPDVVEKQTDVAASSTCEEYLRPDQMSEAEFAELARGDEPLHSRFTPDVVEKQIDVAASSTCKEHLRPDQMSEAEFAELARGMLRVVSRDLQKLQQQVSALEFHKERLRGLMANFAAGPKNTGSMKKLEGREEVLLRRGDLALSVPTLGPKLDSVLDGVLEMLNQLQIVDGFAAELPESPEAEVVPPMRFSNSKGARSSGASSSTSRH